MLILAAHLLLGACAVPLAAAGIYLLGLTLLSGRLPPRAPSQRRMRFDVLVPAHDEAATIARVVASLRRLDWPAPNYRILVICDNCSDGTAALARAAGATVLERNDPTRRGKGYALQYGFAAACRGRADAVLVVDADSEVSTNALEACAARIEHGADAVQLHYGVLNPQASVRTRLMTLAYACVHALRSRARERLGLSCGIRGNGWCLTRAVLQRVPYRAWSLAEDVEYGLELGLAGVRVHYADEAQVLGEMVSGERAARPQRRRWENGRAALRRSHTRRLLQAAWRRRSAVCLDLALDLLLPPLSSVVLGVSGLMALSAAATALEPSCAAWFWCGCGCALALVLYVARGWQLSGLGARGLADLLRAPAFV
ncbi:MAG: glycosyltransferase, partial [Nevskia sp.]|nr:glycosyltransferase [Nevskia sp.]